MAKLSQHQSGKFVKLLFIGDSGTGKTGALVSLVKAGYDLRILDLDNGLDILKAYVAKECPERLDSVDYETVADKYKGTSSGPVVQGIPKAYVDATKLMSKWSDDTIPAEWGPNTVFVLDSFTRLGKCAFEWAQGMMPGIKDNRQYYNMSQESLEKVVTMLTSEAFQCNVIVISHVTYIGGEKDAPASQALEKGFPSTIGRSLSRRIAAYFNTLVLAETTGSGKSARRRIKTVTNGIVDMKTPVPFMIDGDLPLETGLADLFEKIKSS